MDYEGYWPILVMSHDMGLILSKLKKNKNLNYFMTNNDCDEVLWKIMKKWQDDESSEYSKMMKYDERCEILMNIVSTLK